MLKDEELREWACGYFNGDGSIDIYPKTREHSFGYNISSRLIVESSTPHISGLFSAEGTIQIAPSKNSSFKNNYTVLNKASIKMTTSDDLDRFEQWLDIEGIDHYRTNLESEYENVSVNRVTIGKEKTWRRRSRLCFRI